MTFEQQQKLVFVGLGNPGKKYVHTRHNLGFLVIDELASELSWSLIKEKKFIAKVAKGVYRGKEIHLIQPQTYMNKSGESIKLYLDFYKFTASQIVVICDDAALPFGKIRLRIRGSSGGHNGLKSVAAHLRTESFCRLRMGIGHCIEWQSLEEYVLTNFNAEEKAILNAFVKYGSEVLKSLTVDSIAKVMNVINNKLT